MFGEKRMIIMRVNIVQPNMVLAFSATIETLLTCIQLAAHYNPMDFHVIMQPR